MVARGLDRAIAAGTAAHSGHAKHLAHTLKKMALGQAEAYTIKAPDKLRAVAGRLNIDTDGRDDQHIALDVANAALADFHERACTPCAPWRMPAAPPAVPAIPNIHWIDSPEISLDGGVVVDKLTRTSVADVYAAGDAAATFDPISGDPMITGL